MFRALCLLNHNVSGVFIVDRGLNLCRIFKKSRMHIVKRNLKIRIVIKIPNPKFECFLCLCEKVLSSNKALLKLHKTIKKKKVFKATRRKTNWRTECKETKFCCWLVALKFQDNFYVASHRHVLMFVGMVLHINVEIVC